jgi:hypothetical protein
MIMSPLLTRVTLSETSVTLSTTTLWQERVMQAKQRMIKLVATAAMATGALAAAIAVVPNAYHDMSIHASAQTLTTVASTTTPTTTPDAYHDM